MLGFLRKFIPKMKYTKFILYNEDKNKFCIFTEKIVKKLPKLVKNICRDYSEAIPTKDISNPLLRYVQQKYNQGELCWQFKKVGNCVSVFTFSSKNNKIFKYFLSGEKRVVFQNVTYIEDNDIDVYDFEVTVADILKEKWENNCRESFLQELENFINEVFLKFPDNQNDKCLSPVAWDILPKNCFYDDKKCNYIFYDKEVLYNHEFNKSMYLANLCIDIGYSLKMQICEMEDLYARLIDKYKLDNIWEQAFKQRAFDIEMIVNANSDSCYALTNSILEFIEKE